MKKNFLSFAILGIGIIISGFLIAGAFAQTISDIQYPVKELGNCASESSCKTYCDKPQNIEACVNFAEKNNLMTKEELQQTKNFLAAGAKGPGGCTGKDSCELYCNDISHIDECVSYAEKYNIMSAGDLAEAKKVRDAIKKGVKPPACNNKKDCDVYCSQADHMEECITFAQAAGFMSSQELEESQKMLAAIKRGVKPPPCHGKEACNVYCNNPDNMEVCMNFAIAAGFMSEQEQQDSQKMLQAIKKGVKPPNCNGKEQCDVYCSEENHMEECMKFAEAAGFMTAEDAAMARKTGGKGPDGCKNKDECESFCNKPENQQTCFNFGKENGLISEEDLQKMEQGKKQFQEALNQAPSEVLQCLTSAFGADNMEKYKSGAAMPSQETGDKMRECFEKSMSSGQQGTGQTGPGNCKSPEECQKYCTANPQECQSYRPSAPAPESGGMPSQGMGMPGQPNMPAGPMEVAPYEMPEMPAGENMPSQIMPPAAGIMPLPGQMPSAGQMAPGAQMPNMTPGQPQPMMQPDTTPTGSAPGTAPAPEQTPAPASVIAPESLLGLIFSLLGL